MTEKNQGGPDRSTETGVIKLPLSATAELEITVSIMAHTIGIGLPPPPPRQRLIAWSVHPLEHGMAAVVQVNRVDL